MAPMANSSLCRTCLLGAGFDKQCWYSFYAFDMATYRTGDRDIWFFWISLVTQMWPTLLVILLYAILTFTSVSRTRLPERIESPSLCRSRIWLAVATVVAYARQRKSSLRNCDLPSLGCALSVHEFVADDFGSNPLVIYGRYTE